MREHYSDGYALAWVIIIMMILFLFLGSAMSVSSGRYSRNQAVHDQKQAALTARTLSQVLANEFTTYTDGKGSFAKSVFTALEEWKEERVIQIMEVSGLDSSMGACTVEAVYDKSTRILTLTVICVLNGKEEIVSVDLWNEPETDAKEEEAQGDTGSDSWFTGQWNILGYRQGESVEYDRERISK